jgi:hypothetical protein
VSALQKPTHAFAILLWVVAFMLFATEGPVLALYRTQTQVGQPLAAIALAWLALRSSVVIFLWVASAGFIIDLIDHLRWLATPADERAALRDSYLFVRWRKSRVS